MVEPIEAGLRGALSRVRRNADVPVAFAGLLDDSGGFRISQLAGTRTRALSGLAIAPGSGLGGKVVALARPASVADYQASRGISHEYDAAVTAEGLCSVLAVPVVVRRRVRGVLYAALRQQFAFGDRALRTAVDSVRELERSLAAGEDASDVQRLLGAAVSCGPDPAVWEEVRAAHAELRLLALRLPDDGTRGELLATCDRLAAAAGRGTGQGEAPPCGPALSPREVDVVSCVAAGGTNADIAERTGLRPETVKSYLRSAMRKLGTHTRLETVTAARRAGRIP